MRKTIESEIERQRFQQHFENQEYEAYITLLFHRPMRLQPAHSLVDQWDRRMSRKITGRNFHRACQLPNRMRFWGAAEETKQGHRHYHLLISLPNAEMLIPFQHCLSSVWAQTLTGGTSYISSTGPFTTRDKERMVIYNLKALAVDDTGHLNTESLVFSRVPSV